MGPLEITGTARLVVGLVTGILFWLHSAKRSSHEVSENRIVLSLERPHRAKSDVRGDCLGYGRCLRAASVWLGQSPYQASLAAALISPAV